MRENCGTPKRIFFKCHVLFPIGIMFSNKNNIVLNVNLFKLEISP